MGNVVAVFELNDSFRTLVETKLKAGESVVGLQFRNSKGSVGTILSELSARGKLQASMTCMLGGPDHIRERSDWHQSYVSPEKSKSKSRATGGPNSGKSMRTPDGQLLRYQDVLLTDSAELVVAKEANNVAFQAAKDARDAAVVADKARKADERKQKLEAQKAERAAKKEVKIKLKLEEGKKKLQDFAASLKVPTVVASGSTTGATVTE